ncbi:uncharacterized protein LOC115213796 [Argonauta hians]
MAQMETAFPDAQLSVPSYVMESSSNHPCHRLSIPAARLFWCRHCMQIFEDPITRWRHSKTCLNSSSRNIKKDRDGRTMQVFVNANNLSPCHIEESESKVVSRGVGTGKSPNTDLRCRICKKVFISIEEMRSHVRTPCRKRPSLGVSKHKYTARHNDIGGPISIPDNTSEIIYIKDGHQTVFSLESQPESIKTEPVEPQPSIYKENAFHYESCGNGEDVIIIPDTFDNTSNLNTIEQTVEITAVEMVPPVVSKTDDIIKQSYKCKENKENNVRKRKRILPKEIEDRPSHKANVSSSPPKGDMQIILPPMPSITDIPKDIPESEEVDTPMVKIAKVMKDLEDLLIKQPANENVVTEKIEELLPDTSKGLVTDNLPIDVITDLCENSNIKVELPDEEEEEAVSSALAQAHLKDLFTSVKMKNQVTLSPKSAKTINPSAASPQKTNNSSSKCTVVRDLTKSNLSPNSEVNLCLDMFMPVNAFSVTLPDPLVDLEKGMPAEVLLDETTSTKPPHSATLSESILSQDLVGGKEENKLPSHIFEGDLLRLQEHSDVLFDESTIEEKGSSDGCTEEVLEIGECLSSCTNVVASGKRALINELPAPDLIDLDASTDELLVVPNKSQEISMETASGEITMEERSKVKTASNLAVKHPQPDIEIISNQPEIQVINKQPEVELIRQEPEILVMNKEPEILVMNKEPDIQVINNEPDIQVINNEPDIQLINNEPEIQLINNEPEIQLINEEPEIQVIRQNPEIQVINNEPDIQVINNEPEVQVINKEPDIHIINDEPEVEVTNKETDVQVINKEPEVLVISEEAEIQFVSQEPDLQGTNQEQHIQARHSGKKPKVPEVIKEPNLLAKCQETNAWIKKPQVKENLTTECGEKSQMEEQLLEADKTENYEVVRHVMKRHSLKARLTQQQHQLSEQNEEIMNREEELEDEEEDEEEESSMSSSSSSSFPCKEKKKFIGKYDLETKQQKSPKLFKCKACSNTFKSAQALQKHSRIPCKVKHTRSLCQKILRPKRPCVKIEKKPIKKKVVKPSKRSKLMAPFVPITRPEVSRPSTPKRPRRFSRRKRRKSSFVDEEKRILPFVNVLMSELSFKDLFFYKLGLINNSCKPDSLPEVVSEISSQCELGKNQALIAADSLYDNSTEMADSSVNFVESVSIYDGHNTICASMKTTTNKPVLELKPTTSEYGNNHDKDKRSDIKNIGDSYVNFSLPHGYNKKRNCNSQNLSGASEQENLALQKSKLLLPVTCNLKDSLMSDSNKTFSGHDKLPEPDSLPDLHTLESVKLLRKTVQDNNPVSIGTQDSRSLHLSTNPKADDNANKTTKKNYEYVSTAKKVVTSSGSSNRKRKQILKPLSSSVVSSNIVVESLIVSNKPIARSDSLCKLSHKPPLNFLSSPKSGKTSSYATSKYGVFHEKSSLHSDSECMILIPEKASSTSLPLSKCTDKKKKNESSGKCLPNQRPLCSNEQAADSPSCDVDCLYQSYQRLSSDSSEDSQSSVELLHIESSDSNSMSKNVDCIGSSQPQHFSNIFGNENSSLGEKDKYKAQHSRISSSKEGSKHQFKDFSKLFSKSSVDVAPPEELTHLSESSLSRRDFSQTQENSLSDQHSETSSDCSISCQHTADTAKNPTCRNAEEAKTSKLDLTKIQQVSPVIKRTQLNHSSTASRDSIESHNALNRSPLPRCCNQPLESSMDVGLTLKNYPRTDSFSDSLVSPRSSCTLSCPLKIHDNPPTTAHVLSLRHRVSVPTSPMRMSTACSMSACQASLTVNSPGKRRVVSTGTGTESPLHNSTKCHYHCPDQSSCTHTTTPFSHSSIPPSSSTTITTPSLLSSSSSCIITSVSHSTSAHTNSSSAPHSCATANKEICQSNSILNSDSDSVMKVSCVSMKNRTEPSANCHSTAANTLAILVEDSNSGDNASNTNPGAAAQPSSCSKTSASEGHTGNASPKNFCLSQQKSKCSLCSDNNEELSVPCNCCSNSSNICDNINNSNCNHQYPSHHHHSHHHKCNSNTKSSCSNARGPLITEPVSCVCCKKVECGSTGFKGDSSVMSCRNPFQSRVIPSSVICVKRTLNPRISVSTQTDSSYLMEARVIPADSLTSEMPKTGNNPEVIDLCSTTSATHLSLQGGSSRRVSLDQQQQTSEEVVQEEILLDANTLPLVGETLSNTPPPSVECEEIQYDTEHRISPLSDPLSNDTDSAPAVTCLDKASNSMNSSSPSTIGATELMEVSGAGSESNVYVQYVGDFDPSLLPGEVTFLIIQSDSGEGLQIADGQDIIIDGSGFEESASGASNVAYALQQSDIVVGESECTVSER